jgi:branched-chain amino acid transport system ATP-binding protein
LIRSVSGLLPLHSGQITGGSIHMDGQSILNMASHKLVRMGMGQVPEGRLVFKQLTVEENLRVGAAVLPRSTEKERMDAVYELFPRLLERRTRT